MFLGEYQHTLDDKGRVSLPAKFRGGIPGGRVVISKGLEGCLYVTPEDGYQDTVRRLMDSSPYDEQARRLRRFFLSGAAEAELDKAGRVTVPSVLRQYAELDKDLTVIGAGDWIEVWDTSTWEAYNAETAASLEESAAELADKGTL
jgi:MraZ protein